MSMHWLRTQSESEGTWQQTPSPTFNGGKNMKFYDFGVLIALLVLVLIGHYNYGG